MTNAYIRLLIQDGTIDPYAELTPDGLSSDHYAPQDNWVRCRQCPAEAAHVRDLQHEDDCWGLWTYDARGVKRPVHR